MEEHTTTTFQCGYCDKVFYNAKECEEHEKLHSFPVEILNIAFEEANKYPSIIQVKFDNNNTIDYIRNDGRRIITSVYGDEEQKYFNNLKTDFFPRVIWNKVNIIMSKIKSTEFLTWNREHDVTLQKRIIEEELNRGDVVYRCHFDENKNIYKVKRYKIYQRQHYGDKTMYNLIRTGEDIWVDSNEIGFSIFLTKKGAKRIVDRKNDNMMDK